MGNYDPSVDPPKEREKESLSNSPTATATEQSEPNGYNERGYKHGDPMDPGNRNLRNFAHIQLDQLKSEARAIGIEWDMVLAYQERTLIWTKEKAMSKLNNERGDAILIKHKRLAMEMWELGINTREAWNALVQKVDASTFGELHVGNIAKLAGAVADEMGITQASEAAVHIATPVEGDIAHE